MGGRSSGLSLTLSPKTDEQLVGSPEDGLQPGQAWGGPRLIS